MEQTWLDARGALLTDRCPLPLDAPFTVAQAHAWGVSRRAFDAMVRGGLVRRVVRGVYAASQVPDDLLVRAQALSLVVPETAMVTDRTAAWLHGVDILARSAVSTPPPIEVVHVDDTRVRRSAVDGRRRGLVATDITVVHGVQVTTALRTALDLGRLLWRFDALAAIDAFLRSGVPQELLLAEIGRFRGYRGVRQLRGLAPLGDGRAESPGESALRLHWYDAGLPKPELQWWIQDDDGSDLYRLDLTDPEMRYAAEYDGAEFHTSEADREHDGGRRAWICEHRLWTIDAFTKDDVYRPGAWPVPDLNAGYARARREKMPWTPQRRSA